MHEGTWQMNSCGLANILESLKTEFSKSNLRVCFFKALSMLPRLLFDNAVETRLRGHPEFDCFSKIPEGCDSAFAE